VLLSLSFKRLIILSSFIIACRRLSIYLMQVVTRLVDIRVLSKLYYILLARQFILNFNILVAM
jgi:hypothetical protein